MLAVFVAHVVTAEPNYRLAMWEGLPGRDPAATFGATTGQYAILTGGHAGLDLFLALSAYLLGRPFLAWALGDRRPGLGRFAIRRALRILPTFWAVCALVVLWLVVLRGAPLDAERTLRTLTLTHGLQWGWAVTLEQAWSVRVEALGYLLLPLLGAVWFLAGRLLGRAGVVLALLATAVAAVAWALTHLAAIDAGPSVQLWLFLPGLAAALVESDPRLRERLASAGRRTALSIAGVGLVLLLAGLPVGFEVGRGLLDGGSEPADAGRAQLVAQMVLQATGAAMVLIGLLAREWQGGAPPVGLASAPMRWLGGRSYSFYLLHYAVIGALLPHVLPGQRGLIGFVALGVVAFVVTLALTVVLHRTVERPGMLLAARLTGSAPPGPLSAGDAWRPGRGAATGTRGRATSPARAGSASAVPAEAEATR
jgi:peptidoglycan/LPS O-acetylase OafA/YrhL